MLGYVGYVWDKMWDIKTQEICDFKGIKITISQHPTVIFYSLYARTRTCARRACVRKKLWDMWDVGIFTCEAL